MVVSSFALFRVSSTVYVAWFLEAFHPVGRSSMVAMSVLICSWYFTISLGVVSMSPYTRVW